MTKKLENQIEKRESKDEAVNKKKTYSPPDFEKHLPLDNVGSTYYYYYYYYY